MAPKRIIIIRHCDKPEPITGTMCDKQGYERARLLAGFYESTFNSWSVSQNCYNYITGYCNPYNFWTRYIVNGLDSLYAAVSYFNKQGCQTSNRMCLVLEPTAFCYSKIINNARMNFCVDEYPELLNYIQSVSKDGTVIIAWEHHHIPLMINYLFNRSGSIETIAQWPKEESGRFDLVFIIDCPFTKDMNLTITTQELGLVGDSLNVPKVWNKYSY